jgi:hypothetical protein
MSIPPSLLALGILFIFGMIVVLMIRTSRREKLEQENQLHQLGFTPLQTAPIELERRLGDLYDPSGEREIRVWQVYHRRELEQDLYLFDVGDTRGETSEIGTGIFGLISPQLALPRFSLITLPDFNRDSLIGSLMDKLLAKVMSFAEDRLQLQQIEFPDRPNRTEQLIAFGQDPEAVRQTLDRAGLTRNQIAGPPLQIAGIGDLLTVDFSSDSNFDQAGQGLASRYQTFVEISRRFKS